MMHHVIQNGTDYSLYLTQIQLVEGMKIMASWCHTIVEDLLNLNALLCAITTIMNFSFAILIDATAFKK